MLHCLFCRPLNSIVKSVQDIATKYKGPSENKKKACNKIHNTSDSKNKADDFDEYYFEDLTSNNEFMKRYKLLNGNKCNETFSRINIKNDGCLFLKENKASGGNDSKQLSRIDKVISSIKCLTDCVELCGISNVVLSSSNNEWIRNRERKFHKTFNKQRLFKKSRETYNYIFTEYECLPSKHAPSVLYKICYILDQILSYVGYIALNTWKKNKLNQMKLNKLHTIHLYLLFARKELMIATEFYTANKEQRLVKKKINSLWWALNAAKKQLKQVKRNSQINVKYTTINYRKSTTLRKQSMFNLLKNCCLDGNYLKYKRNKLRRCITDINLPKISSKVLTAFRIDKKTLMRRPQTK